MAKEKTVMEKEIKKCDAVYCIGMKVTERKTTGYGVKTQSLLAWNTMSREEFIGTLGKAVAKSLFEIAKDDKVEPSPIVKRFLGAFLKEASEHL